MKHILALDQGTTSSRSILYDETLRPVASAQREFAQHFPEPGRVEHDANEIWETTASTAREAVQKSGVDPRSIAAMSASEWIERERQRQIKQWEARNR